MSDAVLPEPIGRQVLAFEWPGADWRKAAVSGELSAERHRSLRAEEPCLNAVRVVQNAAEDAVADKVHVIAWNLERCKHVKETAKLLQQNKADICLLSEMDLGMARSDNVDTTAELAQLLGMGHVFGTEFIELGHGDRREQHLLAARQNLAGLHGNAVLSRFPIDEAWVLPLDNHGLWYWSEDCGDQRRIGGRNAVAVRLSLPNPFWVVTVHYESRLGPLDRASETDMLLRQLDKVTGSEPVLIGGDFNCKGLQEAGLDRTDILGRPATAEPMFDRLKRGGYDWRSCNSSEPTTRNHPWTSADDRSPKKIDWFFARNLACHEPSVIAATDVDGRNLSDHEAISVRLALP